MSAWAHAAHVTAWTAGVSAVAVSSLAIVRALRIEGVVRTLLACAIVSCAQIVLAVEALSLLGWIGTWTLLALHVGVAVTLLACGLRPAPPPFRRLLEGLRSTTRGIALRILLGAVLAAAVAMLALVYRVPPNNHDGLTYHMTRVATYLQQGSLDATRGSDLRTSILPANAEILILWQVALLRHDVTAGLVQWLGWMGAMLAAFGLGREAGLPERKAAFGALAFGTLPAALLQATSVQNDLTTAFFVAAALVFASRALDGGWPDAVLAGTAFGLAVGTKPTAAMALPGFALFVAARWRSGGGPRPRQAVARLALAGLLGATLLGGYVYAQNLRRFGSPSGPAAFRSLMSPDRPSFRDAWSNGGRLALLLLDPAGVVPPDGRVGRGLARGFDRLTDAWFRAFAVEPRLPSDFMRLGWWRRDRLRTHEDLAVFGPFYGALLAVLAVVALVGPRVDPRMRALGAGVLLYLVGVAVALRYQPFHGRLLLTAAVLGAPLLGSAFRVAPGLRNAVVNLLLVAACLPALATCVLYNEQKPWLGPRSVWRTSDRVARMGLGRPGFETALRLLERLPPGRLAAVPARVDTAVYPLFGPHLDRPVTFVHVGHLPEVTVAALPEADYLLVGGESQSFYVEGEPRESEWPWIDRRDLRSLRRELAVSGSGWSPLLDGAVYGDPFILYARGPGRPAASRGLPAVLTAQPELQPDGSAPSTFTLPVLLDPSRPTLVVSGSALPSALPMRLQASLASGEVLTAFEAGGPERFEMPIPLARAFAAGRSLYVPITVTTTRGGEASADPRDVVWSGAAFELRGRD